MNITYVNEKDDRDVIAVSQFLESKAKPKPKREVDLFLSLEDVLATGRTNKPTPVRQRAKRSTPIKTNRPVNQCIFATHEDYIKAQL